MPRGVPRDPALGPKVPARCPDSWWTKPITREQFMAKADERSPTMNAQTGPGFYLSHTRSEVE